MVTEITATRRRRVPRPRWSLAVYAVGPLVVLGVWGGLAAMGVVNALLLPSPVVVGSTIVDLVASGEMPGNILLDLGRFVIGLPIGVALGCVLGLVIAHSPELGAAVAKVVDAFRQLPGLAWIPLAVIWFGIGALPAIFVLVVAVIIPVAVNVGASRSQVPPNLWLASSTLGLTQRRGLMVRQFLVPAALPALVSGTRIGAAVGWAALITTGMVAGANGMGYQIEYYRRILDSAEVIAYVLAIGLVGVLIDAVIRVLGKVVTKW